jgi:hypothetical protein
MSLGPLFDISLGIILVILVLSLIASCVQEMVSSLLALRARNLRSGLRSILNNRMLDEIYAHGRIRMLGRPHGSAPAMPSYIPTHTLAIALTDLTFPEDGQASPLTREALLQDIDKLEESPIKDALKSIVNEVDPNLDVLRERLAISFDESMDRISGWYARCVKYMLLGIGLGIAVVLNVDIFRLAAELWTNADLRTGLAGLALEARGEDISSLPPDLQEKLFEALPFGWGQGFGVKDVLSRFPGWLATGFAVSLGAPFWFDTLNRIANLRGAGKKPKA